MFGWDLTFYQPVWLLLLLLLPLLWWFSFRSLAGLGRTRRLLALGLRTLVLVLFVLALAEIQLNRTSDKMTVIYVLDQSQSIPPARRQAMMEYVAAEVQAHRSRFEDRAGVIVFGADAVIEIPPFNDDIYMIDVESTINLRTDATNLASALKLAQASFPKDSSKRVVIVSDGNENLGDARRAARALAEAGIGVDAAPIFLDRRAEIAVSKVALPADIRQGQTFEARVVIDCFSEPTPDNPKGLAPGKLRLNRYIGREGSEDELIAEIPVVLEPGKNVFSFKPTITRPAPYTYRATFTPDDPTQDITPQNNTATAFTHVQGKGRVLLIEDQDHQGEFDFLVDRLRANNIEVDVQASNQLFTSLAELQFYDSIVLADTPRSSGDDADTVSNFTDEQIDMLVQNTEQMGCGLVMLGGPRSFGAGGWSNTRLEEAMPVDFQIKNAKVQAVGALALMMHASEMAQGNHWQKVTAREAIKALGPMDYCGLIHWSMTGDEWLWGGKVGLVRVGAQKQVMLKRLDQMSPGDMPQFDPAMRMALAAFNRTNASVKHMIIISDGDPSPPAAATIQQYVKSNIQVSTVAVGTHGAAGSTPLQQLAADTGGKYYVVKNPKALPRIYQREARRVARPLIFEPDGGVSPQVVYPHEMLTGIEGPLHRLRGYMMTTVKDSPLVEVSLRADKPDEPANSTLLASWTFGVGRTVAFTSDAGNAWADSWKEQPYYDKLFSQIIRWSMRPVNEQGKFTVSTDAQNGKVQIVVTALNPDDEFLNFLNISGGVVTPQLEQKPVTLRQEASGRYVGEFDADEAGSYFLALNPGGEYGLIRAGVNVPYSSEFTDRNTNIGLLTELADQKPTGGEPGSLIEGSAAPDSGGPATGQNAGLDTMLKVDTFRRTLALAISSRGVWPFMLLIASVAFFGDVLIRRVMIGFEWITPLLTWFRTNVLRQEAPAPPDERIARLRNRKAAIAEQLDQKRAAARFEPDAAQPLPERDVRDALNQPGIGPADRPQPPASGPAVTPGDQEESYTDRLKKAKKKAFGDRNPPPS
ncbi:VWA domain-containing protein [Lignipirellula cremea]|uniref:von Willebrand factor type A domain protein n=1 Tax=Lignipirellula cremea TaxID=2528010 RepID=A0A518DU93_9BACT|nr:VWA domain-containing protein [Lignipirellula cremea]QDU95398.1 von Willebrand factor type A domain protein [Lignipirellula cremea]